MSSILPEERCRLNAIVFVLFLPTPPQSGLTQAVRESTLSLQEAEMQMLSLLRQHTPPGKCVLAGNTVHADKQFLEKHMPQFMKHLHYRIVDVSTIKELCRSEFTYKEAVGTQERMLGC